MPTLRREVELPRRRQRVPVYLGLGSLLFSLLIVVDAARWSGAAAEARHDIVRRDRAAAAARLRASGCRAAREAEARAQAAERPAADRNAEDTGRTTRLIHSTTE